MTFSLNNYAPGDPRLAQAKLWEGAFLEEMKAFQRRTAGRFQVTFMAEVGLGVPGSGGAGDPGGLGGSPCLRPGRPVLSDPGPMAAHEEDGTWGPGQAGGAPGSAGLGVCVHSAPWRMRSAAPRPRTCPSSGSATSSSSSTSPWLWAATPAGAGWR